MSEKLKDSYDKSPVELQDASLFWLMDASLFIDENIVDSYYDAILRPISHEEERTICITEKNVGKISGKLGVKGEVSPKGLAGKLLSGSLADIKVEVAGEVSGENQSDEARTEIIKLTPVSTPHRRLEQLALHYIVNHTDRVFLEKNTRESDEWRESKIILQTPRALAFFNLPSQDEAKDQNRPETRLIPAAAEFENGEVVPIYQNLQFERWVPPQYPELKGGGDLLGLQEERKQYWAEFAQHYSATEAMRAVEEAAKGRGRIRWIAFRLPLTDEGDSLHLDIHAAERYDTGTFAYRLIKRGNKHGLRIVGMLKSEPDLNVLAIYEK